MKGSSFSFCLLITLCFSSRWRKEFYLQIKRFGVPVTVWTWARKSKGTINSCCYLWKILMLSKTSGSSVNVIFSLIGLYLQYISPNTISASSSNSDGDQICLCFFSKKNAWWCQNCIRRIILQIESNQGKKSQWKRAKHQNYLCVFDSTPAFSLFSVFKLQYWLKLLKRLFYVRSHPLVAVCRWVSVGVTFFKLWTQILKLSEFLFCLFLMDP